MGASVTCPLHAWVFDLKTGQAQGADNGQVRRFAVQTEGGRVYLDASLMARRNAA